MTIDVKSFRVLEASLSNRLFRAWKADQGDLLREIGQAYDREDETQIDRLIGQIDGSQAWAKTSKFAETMTDMALLFGASRVTRRLDPKQLLNTPRTEQGMDQFLKIFKSMVVQEVPKTLGRSLSELFGKLDRQWYTDQDNLHIQKASVASFAGLSYADAFQTFVDDEARGLLDIGSSLHTSRLSSWGFTAEAQFRAIRVYQVNEVLDGATCPICQEMHGKRFEVEQARTFLETLLTVDDASQLKNLAPWPKRDQASLAEFKDLDDDEIVSRGWHIPPYHPGCRGILSVASEQRDEGGSLASLLPDLPGPARILEDAVTPAARMNVKPILDWGDVTNRGLLPDDLRTLRGYQQGSQMSQRDIINRSLDEAFERVEPTRAPLTLYRGVPPGTRFDTADIGDVVDDPGYASTSTLRRVGEAYASLPEGTLLVIEAPRGVKALNVTQAAGIRALDETGGHEAEILLTRGQRYKVIDVQKPPKGAQYKKIVRVRLII